FALPWMDLQASTSYHPCDIDQRLVAAINVFLAHVGRPATARCQDVLAEVPTLPADVALLLKALPCLEQQEKGAAGPLLRALRARWAVVSFPLASLGGHDRGMRATYARRMDDLVAELAVPARSWELGGEAFYLLDLRGE